MSAAPTPVASAAPAQVPVKPATPAPKLSASAARRARKQKAKTPVIVAAATAAAPAAEKEAEKDAEYEEDVEEEDETVDLEDVIESVHFVTAQDSKFKVWEFGTLKEAITSAVTYANTKTPIRSIQFRYEGKWHKFTPKLLNANYGVHAETKFKALSAGYAAAAAKKQEFVYGKAPTVKTEADICWTMRPKLISAYMAPFFAEGCLKDAKGDFCGFDRAVDKKNGSPMNKSLTEAVKTFLQFQSKYLVHYVRVELQKFVDGKTDVLTPEMCKVMFEVDRSVAMLTTEELFEKFADYKVGVRQVDFVPETAAAVKQMLTV